MSKFKLLLGCIASPTLLLAQLTNNTVTATASQSASTTPDQAVISINVSSGASATLEQIVNSLSSAGVTASNLNTVSDFNNDFSWNFQLTVPLAQLESTTAAFASIEKSISQNNSGLSLSFYISGTQYSGQGSTNCDYATLLAQTRSQAQQIASAVGLQTGAITALSAANATCSLTSTFAIPTLFARPGPNTITIAASGTSVAISDQATVNLSVTSPSAIELNDITSALSANGITGTSLGAVYTQNTYNPNGTISQVNLSWSFGLTVPLSKLTAAVSQIISAGLAITKQNSGLALNFTSAYASASQSQQAIACSQSALVSSAQTVAQQIAAAAGVSVGPIVNISQGSTIIPTVVSDAGYVSFLLAAPQETLCSLTLQYQLLQL